MEVAPSPNDSTAAREIPASSRTTGDSQPATSVPWDGIRLMKRENANRYACSSRKMSAWSYSTLVTTAVSGR